MFVYIPTREYFWGDRTIPAFFHAIFFSLLVWNEHLAVSYGECRIEHFPAIARPHRSNGRGLPDVVV
jgi:hypothetical protein